ncbi:MAG: GTPase HflX [Lachnospiraceae bacterium]|nr:GTPase HflX [Candidatus Merdinaster equi]
MIEIDIPEEECRPRAILAGLRTDERADDFEHSMDEMKSLIDACDMDVVAFLSQTLPHPDSGTYLGRGKIEELAETARVLEAEYCVFEDNLSPAQMKNIQKMIGIPVWDRTGLILEIFSRRAKTRESRLQVESAYLQYMLPRLTGMWQHLGRQGGGSGSRSNKGVGEKQLELDRRQIGHRIAELERELATISRTRQVQRQGRKSSDIPHAALVGYTNAGKSSLMNRLLTLSKYVPDAREEKQVFEKNMLFATLDTSIRHIYRANRQDFLLSDTVGFIENLPHGLVKAFRSTLEEVKYADLLLIVLDASDPYHKQHRDITEKTLDELEAGDIPRIYILNKSDLIEKKISAPVRVNDNIVYVSTKTGDGIDELLSMISEQLYGDAEEITALVPYSAGDVLNRLHKNAQVLSEEYAPEGTLITAVCTGAMLRLMREYETATTPHRS